MPAKGDWALLHSIVLTSEERAAQVPKGIQPKGIQPKGIQPKGIQPLDTHKVPLEMWVKGRLLTDAEIGDTATVITRTGRSVNGTLIEINPSYSHSFGDFVPELLLIGDTVREVLFGGDGE